MSQRPVDPEDIQIGDRVKSLEFPDYHGGQPRTTDCYVIGIVRGFVEPDCWRYDIEVEEDIWKGKPANNPRSRVVPPVNGTPTQLGGICNGVTKVVRDAAGRYVPADRCECGAYATSGIGKGQHGHADYCPWRVT